MSDLPEIEILGWSDEEADELSKSTFEKDPFHNSDRKIPPSLLSATDIVEYVKKTAMISPFTISKEKLKHASYEACIGENSYIYGRSGFEKITLTSDGYLRVPANEITFVESDITFRLPRYIAARFNLQIKHVHRGLLLGTGPLVDPGFRGKLLIPLHNLTSEDYYIHKTDGFIWLEFTRTTYDQDRKEPYGNYPDYKKISDGRNWLRKASYNEHLKREIPVRSSIRPLFVDVDRRSKEAVNVARQVQRVGYLSGLALFVSFTVIMLTEIYSNRTFTQSAYDLIASKSDNSQMVEMETIRKKIDALEVKLNALQASRSP
ncbi:hypothetical protein NKI48_30585 [Mesorhizobium sp. M0644]|uniref:hypothetical protein n=1 Tax=Mesorhizobium sp. M0644 TaxID=2956979 RepID=UPI00333A5120